MKGGIHEYIHIMLQIHRAAVNIPLVVVQGVGIFFLGRWAQGWCDQSMVIKENISCNIE